MQQYYFFFLAVSFHSRSTREPEAKMHKTLRDFLKHEHPDDSVLGFPFREISSKYLLKQILSGELTGFVGFEGGREKTPKDKVGSLFSFICQRSRVKESEIGELTKLQLRSQYGKQAPLMLKKYLSQYFTLTKSYADYQSAGLLVMNTRLFSWLVRERGMHDFRIRHFLAYRFKSYLSTFLLPLLTNRQREKTKIAQGDPTGCSLTCEILKLLGNSFFGYNSVRRNCFPKTYIRTGHQLTHAQNKLLPKARSINLIGTCAAKEKQVKKRPSSDSAESEYGERKRAKFDPMGIDSDEEMDPRENTAQDRERDLVFSVTVDNSDAKVANLMQVSSSILSNSKEVFFSHIKWLLEMISTKKGELTYMDTDVRSKV